MGVPGEIAGSQPTADERIPTAGMTSYVIVLVMRI